MTTQMHIAAQYLAAAGISFLDKKDDDSHSNLRFNAQKGYLETRPLNSSGCTIALDYNKFALYWLNNNNARLSIHLDQKTHIDVLKWMEKVSKAMNMEKSFEYNLHYDLPYTVTDDYVFKLEDANKSQKLIELRTLAQSVIQDFLTNNQLDSEIRIWPHHFDTGAFAALEDETGISVGLGMAIPDTMHDDYYFYISAYQGHDAVSTSGFKTLTHGNWSNEGFKGAVLPLSGINKDTGVTFFQEALAEYIN
ncbi:hypothetical protein [Aquimarina sp. AU474]|uniref:hypothetical protein n=1 Tax=Aquimarina sp. AU474 TaxID=2108529 RepID=UPI000D686DF8|nr:hypothetical protein [Aquimarina sp. AU474]